MRSDVAEETETEGFIYSAQCSEHVLFYVQMVQWPTHLCSHRIVFGQ